MEECENRRISDAPTPPLSSTLPPSPRLRILFSPERIVLIVTTVLLLTIAFPPYDLSLAAYVCLAPWFVLILREKLRSVLISSWIIGLLFFFINVSWIRHVTWPAWFALAFYLSFFFLVFGTATRFIHRHSCLPITIAAPVGWVGMEYLRSFMITGFPWFFMGHTQYRNLAAIQIADAAGVYGISFMIITVNACLAEALVLSARRRNRRRIASLGGWTLIVVAATFGYGAWRLAQYSPRTGPRICVVQGNIPQSVKMRIDIESSKKMLEDYEAVSLEGEGQEIDLVAWPETMVPGYFNLAEVLDHVSDGYFSVLAREALGCMRLLNARLNAPLLVGGQTFVSQDECYNSAFYFDAKYFKEHGRFLGRYDKVHLVPFGEYLPFQESLPFLKGVLWRLAGYVPDFSEGKDETVFPLGDCTFGVLICYEDTIAPLVRKFRYRDGRMRADFLLNISNDGWFCGSGELDQHLAICAFRAVENRVGIARAVNTGISGFIAPSGRIEAVIAKNGRRKLVAGALVRPVLLDSRLTFYTVYGDLFARFCRAAWAAMVGYCAVSRHRQGTIKRKKP